MKKIPVGATIAHAYRFAFIGFPALVRVAWLPLLVATAANIVVAPQLSVISAGFATHDFSALTMPWALIMPLYVGAMIATFMELTAVFQFAMGRPEAARHRWFYFSLGKPLWRMIGAFLLFVLTMAALAVVYVLAIMVIGFVFNLGFHAAHMTDAAIKTVTVLDTALALLVGYCGFIFCTLRFGFLLFPATIALDRVALFQSWLTSQGNFWRMLLIVLGVFLPLITVVMLGLYLLGAFPHITPGMTPEQIRQVQAYAATAIYAEMQVFWYISYPVNAVLNLLIVSLAAGGQSFAWRALTGTIRDVPFYRSG